jgi:hypothetical protein
VCTICMKSKVSKISFPTKISMTKYIYVAYGRRSMVVLETLPVSSPCWQATLSRGPKVALTAEDYLASVEPLRKCNCMDTCSHSKFEVTKSDAYYPSDRMSRQYSATLNTSAESASKYFRCSKLAMRALLINILLIQVIRRNFLMLNLYMSELSYRIYRETPGYSLGDFQCEFVILCSFPERL